MPPAVSYGNMRSVSKVSDISKFHSYASFRSLDLSTANITHPALDQNLSLVYEYADSLVEQLHKRLGTPLDLSLWFEYYSFDLMGMLGLTIDFKNLREGEHPILWLWHVAHKKLGALNYAPWIKHLLMGIPFVERMKYYHQFMTWANDELQRNIQVSSAPAAFQLPGQTGVR